MDDFDRPIGEDVDMSDLWGLLIFNILCIISIVFIERKKPSEIIGWILVITFLPVIGFAMYLLVGETTSKKMIVRFDRKMYYDKLFRERQLNQMPDILEHVYSQDDPHINRHRDMIMMNERHGANVYTSNNDITLFTNAEEKYESLYNDILNAKRNIHLLYFIFKADTTGKKFISLLAQKAREGVEVRLLYDTIGSLKTRFSSFKEIVDAGGMVCKFFPLISILKINFRNHRKIVVIDGEIAYTGGMNIGDDYIGGHKRARPWRDTHLRVTGSCVMSFQERFMMDWYHISNEKINFADTNVFAKYFPEPKTTGKISAQVVSSGPDVEAEYIKYSYIKMINNAKRYIFMQSPYFIPDEAFMTSLKMAVDSGVDVRLIIPGKPDKRTVYVLTTSYIEELLKNDVKVYLYNGFIHSKMFIMDGEVTSIGTANIDSRSFVLDFEINIFLYDEGFSLKCEQIFLEDVKNSMQVSIEQAKSRGLIRRMMESLMRILSPLL